MGNLGIIGRWVDSATFFSSLLFLPFIYGFGHILYNIYFHKLARLPGPLLWRATRLRYIYSLLSGNLVVDVQKLHEQYGNVIRIAPDEVSFAREDAWSDVFLSRPGRKPFLKNPFFFRSPPGQPPNLATTIDVSESARMRQLVMPAFTERSLSKQEPMIQQYASLFMDRLRELVASPESAKEGVIINFVDWYNWYAFDVIGDLLLGVSFGCLQDAQNHPWVSIVFGAFKSFVVVAAARYFPGLEYILLQLVPASVMKMQRDHHEITVAKTHRRMNLNTQRTDLMTPLIEDNPDFSKMSLAEIESTVPMLLIAGSETTGTTLCGITNNLIQNSNELRKLTKEIRDAFKVESEITIRTTQDLPFLNAVIHEGLRLCNPVAGGLPRIAPEGGGTASGVYLPEGTHVNVHPIALSHSDANFHRAKEFLPDRFLPDGLRPAQFDHDQRGTQKPFGLGGRSCLGRMIALAEMRLVLARLMWNFELSVAPGKQLEWMKQKMYIAVQKEPVRVRFRPRVGGSY